MRRIAARAHPSPVHAQRRAGLLALTALLLSSTRALAQGEPPTAGYPADPGPAPGTAPPPPSGPPPAVPTPAPAPPPAYGSPPQGDYTPPPNDREMRPSPRQDPIEEPVPPPPPQEKKGGIPPFSIRIDPLNWLIEGQLQVELEVGVLKWLSVEVVPSFMTTNTPILLTGFGGRDDTIRRESNGAGPLNGAAIDAGFWLSGKALHGYVLRAIFATYGYEYRAVSSLDGSEKDRFVHTDRLLMGMFGSHSTWGAFTLAGGFGIGVDLNGDARCFPPDFTADTRPSTSGCKDLQLKAPTGLRDPDTMQEMLGRVGVASWSYPVVIAARISLGVTID